MLNKLSSSIMLTCSFAVMPLTGSRPDSLFFIFISPSKWMGIVRLVLALSMFFLSFTAQPTISRLLARYKRARLAIRALGLTLIVFGVLGALEASMGSVLYNYLKPLDILIVIETGVVLTSVTLVPAMAVRATAAKKSKRAAPRLRTKTA